MVRILGFQNKPYFEYKCWLYTRCHGNQIGKCTHFQYLWSWQNTNTVWINFQCMWCCRTLWGPTRLQWHNFQLGPFFIISTLLLILGDHFLKNHPTIAKIYNFTNNADWFILYWPYSRPKCIGSGCIFWFGCHGNGFGVNDYTQNMAYSESPGFWLFRNIWIAASIIASILAFNHYRINVWYLWVRASNCINDLSRTGGQCQSWVILDQNVFETVQFNSIQFRLFYNGSAWENSI